MTQDFRQPSPRSILNEEPMQSQQGGGPAPNQRVVLITLYLSAIGFFLAGLWLMIGEQTFIPADLAPILGMAFITAAAMDVFVVKVLKLVWARRNPPGS